MIAEFDPVTWLMLLFFLWGGYRLCGLKEPIFMVCGLFFFTLGGLGFLGLVLTSLKIL